VGTQQQEPFEESALVLHLPGLEESIQPLRERYTVDGAQGVPPHITIVYPFVEHKAWTAAAAQSLQTASSSIPPLRLTLGRLAWFDEAGVLFLEPEPADDIVGVIRALAGVFPGCPPYGGAIGLDELVPHVSIAVISHGEDRARVEREVRVVVDDLLPVEVVVDQVSLLARRSRRWSKVLDVPLAG